jgi:hypothetical protein
MNKQLPRANRWINNLHENRFAMNSDKMPRICTSVKKGELIDSMGTTDAFTYLDMKKSMSKKDNGLFESGGKSFSQHNLDYDVNFNQVHDNTHKNYQSKFLKSVNKMP